jgi:NAD(P)-binding Rossmann-like domain
MKSGANTNPGRRRFLKNFLTLIAASPYWVACKNTVRRIAMRFSGAPVTLGHRLLTQDFPPISKEERVKILIIGGGISGLSACRTLVKNGETDFLLLEMDHQMGGNSASGENA